MNPAPLNTTVRRNTPRRYAVNWTLIRVYYHAATQYWVAVWKNEKDREVIKKSYWRPDVELPPDTASS